MGKLNFTAERVSVFRCVPGRQQSIYWDRKCPGLGLRVTAAGAKSYVFEARLHGRTVRRTIGDPRTWSIRKAQAEATRLKGLTDKNIDPREVEAQERASAAEKERAAVRQSVTVAQAWPEYMARVRALRSAKYVADHERMASAGGEKRRRGSSLTVAGPLAPLMQLRLADLTGPVIAQWLSAQAEIRPTDAAYAYRVLRAFIRWCAASSDFAGIVPYESHRAREVRDVLPTAKPKHGDCLQREQLASWFDAVGRLSSPVLRVYLQALLVTGARREEIARLRWKDVDFQWRSLTIRDKMDGQRVIPLTPYLAKQLLALKRLNETPPRVRKLRAGQSAPPPWQPSPWVFFSKAAKDGRVAEPRIAHNHALAAAGLPHVTLHGLRRTFGTLCEWVEVPVGIVAQIQGHKPSALVERHYRRRPLDLLRVWHDKFEAWVLKQAGIEFDPEKAGRELREEAPRLAVA